MALGSPGQIFGNKCWKHGGEENVTSPIEAIERPFVDVLIL